MLLQNSRLQFCLLNIYPILSLYLYWACTDSDIRNTKAESVFVSYAYSEGTRTSAPINLLYYLRNGVTHSQTGNVDYGIVVNGRCSARYCLHPGEFARVDSKRLRLWRRENTGLDFGAHFHALRILFSSNRQYDFYIFLNCGVAGPFFPSYMPLSWHWTRAFLEHLSPTIGIVSTSIVCLPSEDLGGIGPSIEGFSFALGSNTLISVLKHGTSFRYHPDKTSAILQGEYALTDTILQEGLSLDCLLSAYRGAQWELLDSWLCNNVTHPSRKESYFETSIHPLDVLFHKVQWGYDSRRGDEARENGKVSAVETDILRSWNMFS